MGSGFNWQSAKIAFISQAQLEKMVTKLKVEKAQVEASLREEEAKCGMLLKEVKDANEVSYFMWSCSGAILKTYNAVAKRKHFLQISRDFEWFS